ncbi:MAG: hypothetical protein KBB01_02395 [Candidatus Omnitrophica bacterium]|nr:hypothetical protein [Candidatus Omnitrophota bacterium]
MIFFCLGINYKTASLELREDAYFLRNKVASFWKAHIPQARILFTCNRIEVYGEVDSEVLLLNITKSFKAKFKVFSNSYLRLKEKAVLHALRLASGLESQIIGEKEIIQQLKSWIAQEGFSFRLKTIWEEVLSLADEIRIKAGLDEVNQNIGHIVLEDLLVKLNKRQDSFKVAIIGTGKLAQIFAQENNSQVRFYFFSSKNYERADRLATISGGQAFLLDELPKILKPIDAVISVTKAPHYILRKETIVRALENKKKPFYIYDLSIPRSIEPRLGNIKGVILKNLESLKYLFVKHNQKLIFYQRKAELLIKEFLEFKSGGVSESEDKSWKSAEQACFSPSR